MSVSGIRPSVYPFVYGTKRVNKSTDSKGDFEKMLAEESVDEGQKARAGEAWKEKADGAQRKKADEVQKTNPAEPTAEPAKDGEEETKTQIVVKPDGSRVLVMTVKIGGMEMTTSLELSKPTELLNEQKEPADEPKENTENAAPGSETLLTLPLNQYSIG